MTSPYVKYSFWEKAGIVLTTSPTATPVTSLPTASTMPADSYPRPAGYFGDSMYWLQRHIDSARFKPIALTLMRTSCGPGAFTFVSMNSRTSGPPAFENLMVRDMVISFIVEGSVDRGNFSRPAESPWTSQLPIEKDGRVLHEQLGVLVVRAVVGFGVKDELRVREVLLQDERVHRVDDHVGAAVHHKRRLTDVFEVIVGRLALRAPLGECLDLRGRDFLVHLGVAVFSTQPERFEKLPAGAWISFRLVKWTASQISSGGS